MSIEVTARNTGVRQPWPEIFFVALGAVLCAFGLSKHLRPPAVEATTEIERLAESDPPQEESSSGTTRSIPMNSGEGGVSPTGSSTRILQPETISHPPRMVRSGSGEDVLFYEGSYALVVGISEYKDPVISDLPGVARDIEKVSQVLTLHGFEVREVLNPSRDELALEYTNFVNEHGQDPNQQHNRLLFYFAGHGINLPGLNGQESGYLIGRDAPSPDADMQGFRRESFPLRNIHNLAEDILTKHALFIFDSCFSGSLFTQNRSPVPPQISRMMAQPVRQFITSGSSEQTVPDESIFCQLLVNALESGRAENFGDDGYLTGSEISRYLAETVAERSQRKQTPLYGKDRREELARGDFVFTLDPSLVKAGSIETVVKDRPQPTIHLPPPPGPTPPAGGEVSPASSGRPGLDFENSLGMRFHRLNPNHFKVSDIGASSPGVEGRIELDQQVWMGLYEVRQEIYLRLMGENPSAIPEGLRPVTNVSWKEAVSFCRELTRHERLVGMLPEGMEYRLPWEAEWELACYGVEGVKRRDDLSGPEWWQAMIKPETTRAVGRGTGNSRGFFDLEENVLEWCGDAFLPGIPATEQQNPRGPFSSETQVVRGTSSSQVSVRIGSFDKYFRAPYLGFRVVLAPKEPEVDENVPQGQDFFQLSQLFVGTEYEDSSPQLKQFVLEIAQRRMSQHGYFSGKPDGNTSAETQTAINDFQWVHRLDVTGMIDSETIQRLKLVGITEDDLEKGADVYIAKTGGRSAGGSSSAGGGGSSDPEWKQNSDTVAEEIVKWSRVRGAVGLPGLGGFGR